MLENLNIKFEAILFHKMGKPYRFRTTVLGHLEISKALKEYGIGVATGEVCQNRVMFKQFLASGAMQFCQIDSGRMAGVNEVIAVLLMAAKLKVRPYFSASFT